MRRLILIGLLPLLVACSSASAARPSPAAGAAGVITAPKTETQAPSHQHAPSTHHAASISGQHAVQPTAQAVTRTEQKPTGNGKPEPPASTWPMATVGTPAENRGIAIGQPLRVGPNSSVVLVTNTTDQVMTFDIATTVLKDGSEVQITGTVADLLPKQSRPAMATSTRLVPADPEAVRVTVTSVRTAAASTPKSDRAKRIVAGEPRPVETSSNVTVEVINNDSKPQGVALYVAYLQGDELVAYGEGQAAGLKPGETRTVTLRAVTPIKPHERIAVSVRVL
jgi:hypothetical protein